MPYAPVNGLRMYYEIHGSGRPLVLIHGGLGLIEMFAPLLPKLAAARQVIAVDLQGHGHTADIERPFSYEGFAADIAALIEHLGVGQADLIGYSLGGGVALQTAICHPQAVRRLVVISAPFRHDGWFHTVMESVAAIRSGDLDGTVMHSAYLRSAPDPAGWPGLVEKTRLMLGKPYDWSGGVAALSTPTLIVVGDSDSLPPAHAAEMFGLLGGGKSDGNMGAPFVHRFAVLPGTTHYDILEHTDLLVPILSGFLDAPMPRAS